MRKGIDCNGNEWEERLLDSRAKNIAGYIIGNLTILFPVVNISKNKKQCWLCQCLCGNQVVRSYRSIQNKTTNSCGCLFAQHVSETNYNRAKKLIGQKFNKLTVVDIAEIRIAKDGSKRVYYKCMCDCGNPIPVIVRGTDLKLGKQLSCGCAKSDAEARDREDLTGRVFGKLTVIGFAYIKNQTAYWHCQCECGNEIDVRGADLKNSHTSSCGCMLSLGELNIVNVLRSAKVDYLHNKGYFKDLVSDAGLALRYDFIIFNADDTPIRLIEFDGPQHTTPNDLFGAKEFQKLQYHDFLKNQYALSHNIPLVRIPYSKRDTITYDDIFGNKYLIK